MFLFHHPARGSVHILLYLPFLCVTKAGAFVFDTGDVDTAGRYPASTQG